MINWKVRLLNKNFWITAVPALFLLVQAAAKVFGVELELTEIGNQILDVINAVFGFLAVLGIVVDPTTDGIGDSERALGYDSPYKDQ